MHDDLVDGVNWAIERGMPIRKTWAISGGQYGEVYRPWSE